MKVVLHYDPVWIALMWAKTHCPSYITNTAVPNGIGYDIAYHFGDEKDAFMFKLTWGGQ
jgi:hypothetical protein